jgi:hypothetical protein
MEKVVEEVYEDSSWFKVGTEYALLLFGSQDPCDLRFSAIDTEV